MTGRKEFAPDSLLEGDGFELSVPRVTSGRFSQILAGSSRPSRRTWLGCRPAPGNNRMEPGKPPASSILRPFYARCDPGRISVRPVRWVDVRPPRINSARSRSRDLCCGPGVARSASTRASIRGSATASGTRGRHDLQVRGVFGKRAEIWSGVRPCRRPHAAAARRGMGLPPKLLEGLPGYDPDIGKSWVEARGIMEKLGYGPDHRPQVKLSVGGGAIWQRGSRPGPRLAAHLTPS
jgi:hypothetical protein